jgi:hypothetical protein
MAPAGSFLFVSQHEIFNSGYFCFVHFSDSFDPIPTEDQINWLEGTVYKKKFYQKWWGIKFPSSI